MDIDEWEFLPDGGYIDFNEVGGGENQIFFGKRNSVSSKSVVDMNYFCTSPKSSRRTTTSEAPWSHQRVPNKQQLVHVPIQLEPRIGNHPPKEGEEEEKNSNKLDHVGDSEKDADQDMVSQVFFKIRENEFADMKLDPPKSGSRGGFFPPFEDKGEMVTSPRMKKIEMEMMMMKSDKEEEEEDEEEGDIGEGEEGDPSDDGFNFWKWGLTGVGAIFSFGVAAATICVLFFGSQQRIRLHQEHHKIRFQIYTDDKRLKQAVQHATKLNEAISAVRGVPLTRAHITYGGYYDGL